MADKYNADQLKALQDKGHTFPGGTSYPIDDAEAIALDLAIKAVGRGGADHDAIRRYIAKRAEAMGMADKIPDNWADDGSLADGGRSEQLPARAAERTFVIEDISIRAGGDGRTVVAYAAVFDHPAEIHDQDGHYVETIGRSAFDKTISERMGSVQVFYNHAKTVYGTPSERFSMPIGTPEEIRPDSRGLMTVTRYNRNPLADEVLESIRNGDLRGQSFGGRFVQSKRTRGYGGDLDTIHRSEVALREYGPTPIPAYGDANIVGVRMDHLAETWRQLTAEQRHQLQMLDTPRPGVPSLTVEAALLGTSPVDDTPTLRHVPGPTRDFRQRRARLLAIASKGN